MVHDTNELLFIYVLFIGQWVSGWQWCENRGLREFAKDLLVKKVVMLGKIQSGDKSQKHTQTRAVCMTFSDFEHLNSQQNFSCYICDVCNYVSYI